MNDQPASKRQKIDTLDLVDEPCQGHNCKCEKHPISTTKTQTPNSFRSNISEDENDIFFNLLIGETEAGQQAIQDACQLGFKPSEVAKAIQNIPDRELIVTPDVYLNRLLDTITNNPSSNADIRSVADSKPQTQSPSIPTTISTSASKNPYFSPPSSQSSKSEPSIIAQKEPTPHPLMLNKTTSNTSHDSSKNANSSTSKSSRSASQNFVQLLHKSLEEKFGQKALAQMNERMDLVESETEIHSQEAPSITQPAPSPNNPSAPAPPSPNKPSTTTNRLEAAQGIIAAPKTLHPTRKRTPVLTISKTTTISVPSDVEAPPASTQQPNNSNNNTQSTHSNSNNTDNHATKTINVDDECKICFEVQINSVLSPCGHFALCYKCAVEIKKKTKKCPICRKNVRSVIQTFRA